MTAHTEGSVVFKLLPKCVKDIDSERDGKRGFLKKLYCALKLFHKGIWHFLKSLSKSLTCLQLYFSAQIIILM